MYKNKTDKEKFWEDLSMPDKSCKNCTRPGHFSPHRMYEWNKHSAIPVHSVNYAKTSHTGNGMVL